MIRRACVLRLCENSSISENCYFCVQNTGSKRATGVLTEMDHKLLYQQHGGGVIVQRIEKKYAKILGTANTKIRPKYALGNAHYPIDALFFSRA